MKNSTFRLTTTSMTGVYASVCNILFFAWWNFHLWMRHTRTRTHPQIQTPPLHYGLVHMHIIIYSTANIWTTIVLRLLKDKFHHCLDMCKSLEYQATLSSTIGRAALELIAPDKLIYDYAIEMCQTAALEEMFGQPEECFKRYQTAQILLHGLLHQVNQDDKPLLEKYKLAVEKRLVTLQYQFQQQQQQILGASSSSSSNISNPFSGLGGVQKRNSSHCSYD